MTTLHTLGAIVALVLAALEIARRLRRVSTFAVETRAMGRRQVSQLAALRDEAQALARSLRPATADRPEPR